MNTQALILDFCGITGVLFHCLLKLNSLKKDYETANIQFNWRTDYLRKDSVSIMLSFLSVIIWHLIFAEVIAKYPTISAFSRVSFVVMGMLGSYLIQLAMSNAKKRIRSIVDRKTNIADDKNQ